MLYELYTYDTQPTHFCNMNLMPIIHNRHAFRYLNLIPDILNRNVLCCINFIPVNTEDTHFVVWTLFTQQTRILLYKLYTHNIQQTRISYKIYIGYTQPTYTVLYELCTRNTQHTFLWALHTLYIRHIHLLCVYIYIYIYIYIYYNVQHIYIIIYI